MLNEVLAKNMTEAELQANVLDAAKKLGWELQYHAYDSRRSTEGFPDLVLCRWVEDVVQAYVVELKTEAGKISLAQERWLHALNHVDRSLTTFVWRPRDWFDGTIEEHLRRTPWTERTTED